MKLLNFSVVRIFVALMFVFSITGNVFAFYHKEDNWLVCDYCGARHINAFPKDGHYAWCKYAPAQSSSSGKSSTVYVPKSNSSDLDSALLGTALISLFSSTPNKTKPAKTPEQIAAEKNAEKEKQERRKIRKESLLKDEQFWQSGDYIVKEGNLKFEGAKAYGVYNTKTQKWVLNADKQKDNKGRVVVFRNLKKDDNIYGTGHIRLLNCTDEKSSYKKPLIWIECWREYVVKSWSLPQPKNKFFIINDKDEFEELSYGENYLVSQNGKYGIVTLVQDPKYPGSYKNENYCGYEIVVPVEYDSIEVFKNFREEIHKAYRQRVEDVYLAKKKDDVYLFDFKGARLSPKLAKYDSVAKLPEVMDDFYMISKGNKLGAVDGNGNILVPLITYFDAATFYHRVKDRPTISFTNWYKNKVKPYLTTKGKYEKEADFQARMNDPKKQEQYVAEQMKNAGKEYIDEYKNKVELSLGYRDEKTKKNMIYDTENEKFVIDEWVKVKDKDNAIGTSNEIELHVPIKEAEAFEKNFKNMKEDALKNATFGICYDVIAIAKITFKMPDGKTYTFDSTKNGK